MSITDDYQDIHSQYHSTYELYEKEFECDKCGLIMYGLYELHDHICQEEEQDVNESLSTET